MFHHVPVHQTLAEVPQHAKPAPARNYECPVPTSLSYLTLQNGLKVSTPYFEEGLEVSEYISRHITRAHLHI